jgi:hypothetical protein
VGGDDESVPQLPLASQVPDTPVVCIGVEGLARNSRWTRGWSPRTIGIPRNSLFEIVLLGPTLSKLCAIEKNFFTFVRFYVCFKMQKRDRHKFLVNSPPPPSAGRCDIREQARAAPTQSASL